jgi:hypothetical protein
MDEYKVIYKNKKMQPKESKSNKHFRYSMIKSIIRVAGYICLGYKDFVSAAILLTVAEGLGIAEEF